MKQAAGFIFLMLFTFGLAQICSDRFQSCLNTFMESSANHPTNTALLCRDTDIFVQCYRSACPVSDADVARIRQDLAKSGFQCDLNVTQRQLVGVVTTAQPSWRPLNNNTSVQCQSAVDLCTRDYVSTALNSTNSGQSESAYVCSLSHNFINCVARSCDTDSVINQIKQGFETELRTRGVTCSSGNFTRALPILTFTALMLIFISIFNKIIV